MKAIMVLTAYLLSFLCLLLNSSLFVRLNPPYSFYFVIFQLLAVMELFCHPQGQWCSGKWGGGHDCGRNATVGRAGGGQTLSNYSSS